MQNVRESFGTVVSNTRPAHMARPGAVMFDYVWADQELSRPQPDRCRRPNPHENPYATPTQATPRDRLRWPRDPRRPVWGGPTSTSAAGGPRGALDPRPGRASPRPPPTLPHRDTDSRVRQSRGGAHPRPGLPPAPPPRRAPPSSPSAFRFFPTRPAPPPARSPLAWGRMWAKWVGGGGVGGGGAARGARRSVQSWLRGTKAPAAGARRIYYPPGPCAWCVHTAAPGFFITFSLCPSREERCIINLFVYI